MIRPSVLTGMSIRKENSFLSYARIDSFAVSFDLLSVSCIKLDYDG